MLGSLVLVVVLVCFTLAALRLLKRATIGRARANNRCWSCRFDLRAIPDATRCPECGTPAVAPGVRPPTPALERLWLLACALALLMPPAYATMVILRARQAWNASGSGALHASAAGTLISYATGGSTDDAMRKAVAWYAQGLADPDPQRGLSGVLIQRRKGTDATTIVARLLDDPSIDPARRRRFVAALMNEYRRTPLTWSTQADLILADLLCGQRVQRYSSGSADYLPASNAPRGLDADEARLIVDALLDIQEDHSRKWCRDWGTGIECAFARGLASREQIERYLRNSFDPVFVLMPDVPPRAGDLVVFRYQPRWRSGTGIPVRLRFGVADPAWSGSVDRAVASLSARRARLLEKMLWRRLAATPWDAAHASVSRAIVSGLATVSKKAPSHAAQAQVMERLLNGETLTTSPPNK